jgi:hypothetical protein
MHEFDYRATGFSPRDNAITKMIRAAIALAIGAGALLLLDIMQVIIAAGFYAVPVFITGVVEYVTDKPFKALPAWARWLVVLLCVALYLLLVVGVLQVLFRQE